MKPLFNEVDLKNIESLMSLGAQAAAQGKSLQEDVGIKSMTMQYLDKIKSATTVEPPPSAVE